MTKQNTTTADEAACEYNLRLECLLLAHSNWKTPVNIAAAAFLYANFLRGTNDAEIARTARGLNNTVDERAEVPENLKTANEVYGKLPPFVPLGKTFQ